MADRPLHGEDVHLHVPDTDRMELDDIQNGVKTGHVDPEVAHKGGGRGVFPWFLLGRLATQIISMLVCLAITIIGLTLTITTAIYSSAIHGSGATVFFMSCYFISVVFIFMVLVWGCNDTLNPEHHAKWKQTNTIDFLKGGALMLGAGSIIYHSLLIVEWIQKPEYCQNIFEVLYYAMSVWFPLAQTYMILLYSKAEIAGSWWKEALSRLMFAFIVACNLCVWYQTLIFESQHAVVKELNKVKTKPADNSTESGHGTTPAHHVVRRAASAGGGHGEHDCSHGYAPYSDTFSPYLYPCTIEYSITCACIIFMMWIRVGGDVRKGTAQGSAEEENAEKHASHMEQEIRPIVVKAENPYFNRRCGLFWSLFVICVTIIVVIFYLFSEYQDKGTVRGSSSILIFTLDIKWNLIILLLVPLCMWKMRFMDVKNTSLRLKRFDKEGRADRQPKSGVAHHRRSMDKALMIISYVGLFVFSLLSMIATGAKGEWLLFFESLLSIFSGLALTVAICWRLMAKRSTTTDHLRTRPGQQILVTLRGVSLGLWVLQTFAIRRNSAHAVQIEFYDLIPWSMVSHIFMPLAILFRFHSAVVLSDVIKASYTGKYVF